MLFLSQEHAAKCVVLLQIDKKIEQVFSTKPQIKKQAPVGGTASGAEIKVEQQGGSNLAVKSFQ